MEPRLIFQGRQILPETSFADIARVLADAPTRKLHVVAPLKGGGPNRPPTAKQDFHKLVESGLASMLLGYQMQLPQIPPAVSHLIRKVTLPKLHEMLQQEAPSVKHKQFRDLCHQHQIKLPQSEPQQSRISGKFQKIEDQQYQKAMLNPDPSMFRLKPGFFKNEDGTDFNILLQFSLQFSGVVLSTPLQLQEWVKA